jgi:acetylglutamate kinase
MKTVVVKIGGSTLGSHDTTIEDLVTLQQRGLSLVVVHGGGKISTEWLARLDIPTAFVRGLRVTNAQTLEVVIAALAGLVNKQLVAEIQARGGKAIGISGVDGGVLEAKPLSGGELGYVGEIAKVNLAPLLAILDSHHIPVVAPLSLEWPAISKEASFILNVNADTAAGEIAAALQADRLVFLTDVAGIMDSSGKVISELSQAEAIELIDSGVASGGMVPKIQACLSALSAVNTARIIDGSTSHALLREIEGDTEGTAITAD